MPSPSYFEDFKVGVTQEFGEYRVTEAEILEFASKYDPQPFHLSQEAGEAMHFGGLCASGWHTCAIAMRMIVDQMPETNKGALGSPGIDELRWTKPVFPGDCLRVKSTILNKRESKSRPDMGTVFMQNEVFNQNDELVMSNKPIVMVKKQHLA
ncbi:MAG: MaoC family dehydratase [Gammaproteobacteria bacterium]|nr:MaoC family dehydratase [Gammaproteobacteria bacterium]